MEQAPAIAAPLQPEAPAPAAPPPAAWAPGQPRPMTPDVMKEWQGRIDRAERKAKLFHPQWERALKRYAEAKVDTAKTDVNALLDYKHVEGKKAQLFHRTPEVTLLPIDPQDPAVPNVQMLPQRQKFLNYELGPKAANAKRALHKTLLDALAASGWLIVKVGYEDAKLPVPPDPVTGLQPMDANGQPVTQIAIWARRYITAVSSMKLLVPEDFHDTDFDASPFLTVKGVMPVMSMRRLGWTIPDDFKGSAKGDTSVYKHVDTDAQGEGVGEFTETWYRASLFDEAVFHPELYRCLILVKGLEAPAWHVDSPHQTLDPQGALTDDSLVGNPIHVGTLRDLIDSAYVPSDLVVGEQLSVELNKFRTDLVRNRKSRSPITMISDSLQQPLQEKLLRERAGVVPQEFIGEGGSQRVVAIVQAGTEPRDNYTAQDYIERDYEQSLGISANQSGNFSQSKRTATEVRTVQGNSSARAQTEQDRLREYFTALVRKFDTIVQRTATQAEVVKVLGQAGAQLWEQWRVLPGKYGYDILPDAGQYVDAKENLSRVLDGYNMLRKDERVNPEELLEWVARAMQRDPSKLIAPAQDKTMDAPKVSVAMNLIDLNDPVAGRMALDLLANEGVKISPDTIELMKSSHMTAMAGNGIPGQPIGANTPPNGHGGSADRTEPVNKHQTQKTGGVQVMPA